MFDVLLDGKHYDELHANVAKDIPFLKKQVAKIGGPVLELGCGTGRIGLPIAQDGVDVTGIDMSESMLDEAHRKASDVGVTVQWLKGDMRSFDLGCLFQCIILGFNALSLLHSIEDFEHCFGCIRRHLSTNGRVLIDTFNPRPERLVDRATGPTRVGEYHDPYGSGRVTITQKRFYDDATQIDQITWLYKIGDAPEFAQELKLRMYFPAELNALLMYNGFQIEAKYGDYNETPFASGSSRQILVARMSTE